MSAIEGAVIAISSQVGRGCVGNRAMVFALERLGFEVWAVPSVLLPHHPGHGQAEGIVPGDRQFAQLLHSLVEADRAGEIAGIVSGYFAHAAQVRAVAGLVQAVRRLRPDSIYLCDPVLGDADALYVEEELALAVRDELLPLADAATPNQFECRWLAGAPPDADLAGLAGRLGPAAVLVTSAPALMRGQIGNLLCHGGDLLLLEHPTVDTRAKGTGDLLAALLLARRLQGHDWPKAAELAVASTFEIAAATAKAGADELLTTKGQDALVRPLASVNLRRLGRRAAPPRS